MLLEELIARRITNIFQILCCEQYGLDNGECFIEIDDKIVIEIPYGFDDTVTIKELHKKATSIFDDLSDTPFYHVNKERLSINDIVE